MATLEAVVQIGEKLRQLRIERAMTQEELAQVAGIGKNTVNRLETNTTEPRPPTLRKLAQALEVDPAELVRGD
jgi:transcriptional regulator with XRE-family HTH domain